MNSRVMRRWRCRAHRVMRTRSDEITRIPRIRNTCGARFHHLTCTARTKCRRALGAATTATIDLATHQQSPVWLGTSADAKETFQPPHLTRKTWILLQAILKKHINEKLCSWGTETGKRGSAPFVLTDEHTLKISGAAGRTRDTGDFIFACPSSCLQAPSSCVPERPREQRGSPTAISFSLLLAAPGTSPLEVRAGHSARACTICEVRQHQPPQRPAWPIQRLQEWSSV